MKQRLSGLCHSAECAQSVEFGRFSAPVCGFVGSALSNDLIPTPGGQMFAWLGFPDSPAPGVIVLHDAGGMSQHHRNQAQWLAISGAYR